MSGSEAWYNNGNVAYNSYHITKDVTSLLNKDKGLGFQEKRNGSVSSIMNAYGVEEIQVHGNKPTTFTPGQIVEFRINTKSIVTGKYIRYVLRNDDAGPANFFPHFSVTEQRILKSSGGTAHTSLQDKIYLDKIHQSYEEVLKIKEMENLNPATYGPANALAAGATGEYYLELKNPISQAGIIPAAVVGGEIRFQILLSDLCTDLATKANLKIVDMSLHVHTIALTAKHRAMELERRQEGIWRYRVLENDVKTDLLSSSIAASTKYTVKLDALSKPSSHLIVIIRPSVLSYANVNQYTPIQDIALFGGDNRIIGIKMTDLAMKQYAKYFKGHIFTVKDNIYLFPFSLDPESSTNGYQKGFTKFTTREYLEITTLPAAAPNFVIGNSYTVSVISDNYCTLEINNGMLQKID